MSRRNSLEKFDEPENSGKPVRKRIRDNHNELERVRRNNQKAQLEALRMALPFQDMDDKASMVSIFIRAREYIGMLEHRIMELQADAGIHGDVNAQLQYHSAQETDMPPIMPQASPLPPIKPNFVQRERQLSVNPDHVQVHHGIPFFNPGFLNTSVETSSYVTPIPSPSPQKPNSPLAADQQNHMLNADILRNFVSDNFLKNGNVQRLSSDEEFSFLKDFTKRRASSILLPVEDETVMIQKRDSYSALFSGLLPDFIDTSSLNTSGEISCNKCQKGMCNMIMIDCDRCHKWYHIKCAKIDSDAIPTNWTCC